MSAEAGPFLISVAILSMVVGGIAISTQAPVNVVLNRSLSDPILTACVSFFVGFVTLLVVWLVSLAVRQQGFTLPDVSGAPVWVWMGGMLGATYVLASLWSVPKIGVLTVVAAAVFGQLLASLIIDAVGAFGLAARDITWTRVLAVIMVMGGLILSRF